MRKAFYTTPVTNVAEMETLGNILQVSGDIGTSDRNDVKLRDEIFEEEFRNSRSIWEL